MELDPLYHDPHLAQFYDIENGWAEDLEFYLHFAAGCSSVLDLGCGTGLFAASVADRGRRMVVGVDAAVPMLDVARARTQGKWVRWVQGDARTIRLNQRFELVVLTGHVFQVFLTEADQSAVLRTIARHLAPDGHFVFDSRNPAVEKWKKWNPIESQRFIEHPTLGQVLAWNDVEKDSVIGERVFRR